MLKHDLSKSDREFRAAFEAGAFAPADFSHRAHVRLAYVYLAESDVDLALERYARRARGLPLAPRHSRHQVSRDADARLAARRSITSCIARPKRRRPTTSSRAIPLLLDSKIMLTHYSADLLFSDEARADFVEPNLDPIPRHAA